MTTQSPFTHELKKFDAKTLAATKAEWDRQIKKHSKEVLASEYQRILDWATTHIDYDGVGCHTFAYGIFEKGSDHADAIVELIYLRTAKKWLKLLNLHLCPSADLAFSTEPIDLKTITTIFSVAVTGTVRLTSSVHPTKVVKLYGRSGTLLAFLKGVGAYIAADADLQKAGFSVTIEGRWLVFTIRK